MMRLITALAAGTLFGAGLALGGMVDPDRVRGFLDIFGRWDPTLAFVMAGAVAVMAVTWRIQARLAAPRLEPKFVLPERSDLDGRLIAGAAVFGIGWGIAGLCPGPGFANLVLAPQAALIFIVTMIGGMLSHRLLLERSEP